MRRILQAFFSLPAGGSFNSALWEAAATAAAPSLIPDTPEAIFFPESLPRVSGNQRLF